MPTISGSLGIWDVEHLHQWKERGVLPGAAARPLIDAHLRIATIGSCFAAEIVRALGTRGFDIAMHPAGLWYNTFSIAQEFAHLFENSPYQTEPFWQTANGRWIHPFKDYHKTFSSKEELIHWSDEIDRQSRDLFSSADVIIVTLGLTEIWESTHTGNIFIQLPPPDIYKQGTARFRPSNFQENLANLEKLYAIIRKHIHARVIVTVSPVPLYATFRDMDVRIANNISKSTLRAVVAEFVDAHEDVDYFHSYEIVTAVDYPGMFMKEDQRHVREAGIEVIMDEFLRVYGPPDLQIDARDLSWLEKAPQEPEKRNPALPLRAVRWLKRKLAKRTNQSSQ